MIKLCAIFAALVVIPICVYSDEKCSEQSASINKLASDGVKNFTLNSSSHNAIEMTWAGVNSGILIGVVAEEVNMLFGSILKPSLIYKITNGVQFHEISKELAKNPIVVPIKFGLQRHEYDPNTIYIFSIDKSTMKTKVFLTTDAGKTWKNSLLPFRVAGPLVPCHTELDHVLYLDPSDNTLYLSTDRGVKWHSIHTNVKKFFWQDKSSAIYILSSKSNSMFTNMGFNGLGSILKNFFSGAFDKDKEPPVETFYKSTDMGANWNNEMKNVRDLIVKGKYIYVLVDEDTLTDKRLIKVSTDGGLKWNHVQLPSITPDQFFDILDIEDEFVFLHVDDPMDTGKGTLYTSDSSGIIFSVSLKNHLYPNHYSQSDFFKVESLPGTYLASVINDDSTIRSVITHNRGATWSNLTKPSNVPCPSGKSGCSLHLVSNFGLSNSVSGRPPMAIKQGVGIILAHGHVDVVQKTAAPNVFVSSDGGYNWIKALDGPYDYQIADHGGLLVALPISSSNPKIIKFSTDEGRCWHEITFTRDDINIQQLIVEPGNKAMIVSVWGFEPKAKKWILFTIDFSKFIIHDCVEDDYETWIAHQELKGDNAASEDGCILGKKLTYKRLKKDALCRKGHSYQLKSDSSACKCTEADYECEYGYSRPENSLKCEHNANIKELDVCIDGNREKIISDGYRKVPGDECIGGFSPKKEEQKMLSKNCNPNLHPFQWEQVPQKPSEKINAVQNKAITDQKPKARSNSVVIGLVTTGLVLIILVLTAIIIILYRRSRTPQTFLHYNILEGRHDDDALLIADAADEELEADSSRLINGDANGFRGRSAENSDVPQYGTY